VQLIGATSGTTQLYATADQSCLIDSGTTLVYLRTDAWTAFQNSLNSLCNDSKKLPGVCGVNGKTLANGYCYQMTETQRGYFPDIQFSFQDAGTFALPHTSYLIPSVNQGVTYYCLGVLEGSSYTVLGDLFMQNYRILDKFFNVYYI
jgi:hypothetical protein